MKKMFTGRVLVGCFAGAMAAAIAVVEWPAVARADGPGLVMPAPAAAPAPVMPRPGAPAQNMSEAPKFDNGQLSQRFRIDDRDPEANIPSEADRNKNPMEFGYYLQDLIARADVAKKKHDNSAVVRYDRALAKAVPDQAKVWGQLCEAYQAVNDRDRAIKACRYAVDRKGVELQDYVRYVGLIVSKPDDLTREERDELTQVLNHLAKDPSVGVVFSHLQCQVGAKTKDVALLETCTTALGKVAPDDPKTVIFKWSLAMLKGQPDEAERLIERAKELGVISQSIERMEKLTFSGSSRRWPAWSLLAGALLFGAVAWLCWGLIRRRAFAR